MASDWKSVQRDDSVPCHSKKFSIMPSDRKFGLMAQFTFFWQRSCLSTFVRSFFYTAALSPLACVAAALGPHCVGLTLPKVHKEGILWFWIWYLWYLWYWFCLVLHIIMRFVLLLWFIIKKRAWYIEVLTSIFITWKRVSDRKPFFPLKGRSVGGSVRRASVRLSAPCYKPNQTILFRDMGLMYLFKSGTVWISKSRGQGPLTWPRYTLWSNHILITLMCYTEDICLI